MNKNIQLDEISIFNRLISFLSSNLNSLSFNPLRLIPPKLTLCNLYILIFNVLNILLISLFLPCLRTSLTWHLPLIIFCLTTLAFPISPRPIFIPLVIRFIFSESRTPSIITSYSLITVSYTHLRANET